MRSLTRSAVSSRPTEIRSRPSLTPIAAASSAVRLACVDVAGWQTSVSGPPSDVATRASCSATEEVLGGGCARRPARSPAPCRHCASAAWPDRTADARRARDSARRRPPARRRAPRRCAAPTPPDALCARPACGCRGCALSASYGDGVEPCSTEYAQIASISSRSPAMTPSVASLSPAMPFVAECSDRCTPWASGCWPSGVANVESTTVIGPAQRTELVEVDELEARVRRCLGERQHRAAGPQRGGERAGLGAVDERDLDAHALARALQERERAGVQLALGDDVIAGASTGRRSPWRWRPCPRRTPVRRRRLPARRSPPRTTARSGSSSGCRTRRRASRWPAGWRRPARRTPMRAGPQRRGQGRSAVRAAGGDRPCGRLLLSLIG